MKTEIVDTNVAYIRAGMTVMLDGKMVTVSDTDIKRDLLLGTTLFGDSYKSGTVPVKRVLIFRATPKGGFWQ